MAASAIDQLVHLAHLVLGFGAGAAAIVALAVSKGGRVHRWAGWTFTGGMTVAAITAWIFMIARPLPLAMFEATVALYALGTAVLALNPRWRWARAGEVALLGVLLLVMLAVAVVGGRLMLAGAGVGPAPLVLFAVFAYFAVLDVRWLRRAAIPKVDRVRRHALRMALAVSETVRAPLITFADDLGLPVPAIVFGTFALVPLIYFAFAPQARKAAAVVRA
ncbi:hypothetical protein N0B51_13575 [Tsuneonella sp. YG55]|uniref:Uncharacterized protein n=1 Tax=Tsuneonella litorea TaxID=2976475 RepID=A0A9X2W3L8_9SPHN|nr:hypothetical protein [Tsuneonella litorea]MCT2560008.1 hypothetical protein [Tsuneonella litorea]